MPEYIKTIEVLINKAIYQLPHRHQNPTDSILVKKNC